MQFWSLHTFLAWQAKIFHPGYYACTGLPKICLNVTDLQCHLAKQLFRYSLETQERDTARYFIRYIRELCFQGIKISLKYSKPLSKVATYLFQENKGKKSRKEKHHKLPLYIFVFTYAYALWIYTYMFTDSHIFWCLY